MNSEVIKFAKSVDGKIYGSMILVLLMYYGYQGLKIEGWGVKLEVGINSKTEQLAEL